MKHLLKPLLILSCFALAACAGTGAGRFGAGGTGAGGTGALGSVSDPASPAFFQQAIGDRVHFSVDQSTLTDEARLILDGQASWLMDNGEYIAVVEGHADEQGTREYNIALSDRRATAVKEHLISRGVAGSRLTTIPYGKERPLAICSKETCYSQNRRAVTVLSAGALG